MRIANTVNDSIVDGHGLRYAVFTQGCPHNCPGCHNPETHDPAGGREADPEALIAFILTEDMRLPMVLFDQWTPMMAALLLLCWIIDIRLMRYRDQEPKEADLSSEE